MREVSPAGVQRQVLREGARYGLRPVMRDGKCHVAQRELVVCPGAVVSVLRSVWEPFRDVDMAHPLSNIWRSRKMRHQYDLAKVMREAKARAKDRDDAAIEAKRVDRVKDLAAVVRQTGMDTFWEAVGALHGKPHPG